VPLNTKQHRENTELLVDTLEKKGWTTSEEGWKMKNKSHKWGVKRKTSPGMVVNLNAIRGNVLTE